MIRSRAYEGGQVGDVEEHDDAACANTRACTHSLKGRTTLALPAHVG